MHGALFGRPPARMQRKAEKNKAADAGQRGGSLRLRRHATTEGFAAGGERKCGHEPGGLRHGGPDRRMRELGRVWPFAPLLHVRKLIAQRSDAALSKRACNS